MERLLGQVKTEDLVRGYYKHTSGVYICCLCGQEFEPGQVYPMDGRFYEAERAAQMHVQAHGGTFDALFSLDKKLTGLTAHQAELLQWMHQGLSDAQIAQQLDVTPSTVRHQRFMFREKAKQARAYLALFELSVGQEKQENRGAASIESQEE